MEQEPTTQDMAVMNLRKAVEATHTRDRTAFTGRGAHISDPDARAEQERWLRENMPMMKVAFEMLLDQWLDPKIRGLMENVSGTPSTAAPLVAKLEPEGAYWGEEGVVLSMTITKAVVVDEDQIGFGVDVYLKGGVWTHRGMGAIVIPDEVMGVSIPDGGALYVYAELPSDQVETGSWNYSEDYPVNTPASLRWCIGRVSYDGKIELRWRGGDIHTW